jgi:hypothetical protein
MDSQKWGTTLEDTLMPKCQPTQTFLYVKEKGKHIPKVASSSTGSMLDRRTSYLEAW